jgi:hypothetical protein
MLFASSSHNAAPYIAGGVFVGEPVPLTPKAPGALGALLPFIHVHSPAWAKHERLKETKKKSSDEVFLIRVFYLNEQQQEGASYPVCNTDFLPGNGHHLFTFSLRSQFR